MIYCYGGNDVRKSEWRRERAMKRMMRKARRWALILLAAYFVAALAPYIFVPGSTQAVTVWAEGGMTPADGDRATILPTGEQAMNARLGLIANAQETLVVGTYLYADDESGHTIAAALLNAADRGVQVRVITDGLIGATNLMGSDLAYALGAHENIELRFYSPVNLLAPWSLNARYHEKYVIADGRALLLGGRNISDEFLTPEDHPAYNYDMDVLVWRESPAEGSVAAELLAYVDALWEEHCAPQYQTVPGHKRQAVEALTRELAERYASLPPEALAPVDWEAATAPIDGFALLTNPTNASAKEPALWAELMALMASARERVWLTTPYLVLNARMRDDLNAVAELPAELRVLTNSRASGNNIMASADLVIHKGMIARMDMDLYEQQTNASLHGKCLLIDDTISVFGSFNFDIRSAYIDTEVMLAIWSEDVNAMLEDAMEELYAQSLPVMENGGYAEGAPARESAFGKELLLHVLSPVVALFRWLV